MIDQPVRIYTALAGPRLAEVPKEVDLAAHPAHQHFLDPFQGRLITRLMDDRPYLAVADPHILLGCDLLWDIVANRELFEEWCRLTPPVAKLDARSNFSIAPGLATFGALIGVPSNKPTRANPMMMCKDWTMTFTLDSRPVAYRIGKYRPSLNVMEASLL